VRCDGADRMFVDGRALRTPIGRPARVRSICWRAIFEIIATDKPGWSPRKRGPFRVAQVSRLTASGCVLIAPWPPTPLHNPQVILDPIDGLSSEGKQPHIIEAMLNHVSVPGLAARMPASVSVPQVDRPCPPAGVRPRGFGLCHPPEADRVQTPKAQAMLSHQPAS